MNNYQELILAHSTFGTEVAEIAHDINNSLAILHGYTSELSRPLAKDEMPDKALLNKAVPKLEKHITKLVEITRKMNHLRKTNKFENTTVNVPAFCRRWFKVTMDHLKTRNLTVDFEVDLEKPEAKTKSATLADSLAHCMGKVMDAEKSSVLIQVNQDNNSLLFVAKDLELDIDNIMTDENEICCEAVDGNTVFKFDLAWV